MPSDSRYGVACISLERDNKIVPHVVLLSIFRGAYSCDLNKFL